MGEGNQVNRRDFYKVLSPEERRQFFLDNIPGGIAYLPKVPEQGTFNGFAKRLWKDNPELRNECSPYALLFVFDRLNERDDPTGYLWSRMVDLASEFDGGKH